MTRKEEITMAADAASRYESPSFFEAFVTGAEWADEHPISDDGKAALYFNNIVYENGYKEAVDKACEWLDDYLTFSVAEWDEGVTTQRVIDKFRKAMKGGNQ